MKSRSVKIRCRKVINNKKRSGKQGKTKKIEKRRGRPKKKIEKSPFFSFLPQKQGRPKKKFEKSPFFSFLLQK